MDITVMVMDLVLMYDPHRWISCAAVENFNLHAEVRRDSFIGPLCKWRLKTVLYLP